MAVYTTLNLPKIQMCKLTLNLTIFLGNNIFFTIKFFCRTFVMRN